MAYLNEGATSLAAANWSDSTGFADNATLEIKYPFGDGSPVTAGLDQSGLTEGIDSLDISAGARGQIGNNGTSLEVDADSATSDYVRNRGNVTLYLAASGDDDLIQNFDFGGRSRNFLTDGTFTNITGDGGELTVTESAVVTNFYAAGGSGVIKYNSTEITTAVITGGTWTIERGVNTLYVGEGARVIYDPDDSVSHTGNTLDISGGVIDWRFGAIPTINARGGQIDFRNARATFTPGGTAFNVFGTRIMEGTGLVSLTNVSYAGAWQRVPGGLMQPL